LSKDLSAALPPTKRTVITASPLTQRETVPETPSTETLCDSVGEPRMAVTSCSLMPSCSLAKFSWDTLEHAASARRRTTQRLRMAQL